MTDFEEIVRARLASAAEHVDADDVTDEVLRAGRRRRRRRTTVAAMSAVVVVAVIVAGSVVVATRGSTTARVQATPSPTSSSPGANAIPDASFRVAAPQLDFVSGPYVPPRRPCRARDIDATAQSRASAYGVVGVVTMRGDCSIYSQGPGELLDAQRRPIAQVGAQQQPLINEPQNIRPDISLHAGAAAWGFTWAGSWCGSAARYVSVPLTLGNDLVLIQPLVVPLTGPQLPCRGTSRSRLVVGVAGSLASAVLSPPNEWRGLRVAVDTSGAVAHGGHITGLVAVISDITADSIALSPCPDYALDTGEHDSRGSERDSGRGSLAPCDASTVVPAHATLRFPLPSQEYGGGSPLGHGGASRGSPVTVWFAIAGVPTATATLHVS